MKIKFVLMLLIGIIALAACAPTAPGSVTLPARTTVAPSPAPTEMPTELPTPTASAPIPVDLTPAQMAAIQALVKKENLSVDQVKLVSTTAMTWDTGCLGVVIPGVMCTKGPVEGFKMILEANGKQYEFHTNQDGSSVVDAAQQLATLQIVVYAADHNLQVVNPTIPLGPTYNPSFSGFLPRGGSLSGTGYVVDLTAGVVDKVDASGVRALDFIQKPTYGLAIWRGGLGTSPLLAWGTQPSDAANGESTLQISRPDGSELQTLYRDAGEGNARVQLVAELWSADGQSLYFSKEPYGIGGYIPFGGASSLYRIDIASKQVTDVIPFNTTQGPATCLDAISGDYRFVADHCAEKGITVRDLTGGTTSTIQTPAGVKGARLYGSARFSPDGQRVVYALAKGSPDDEQGWIALSDGKGGSNLVLASDPGEYFTVLGWLDDNTLLIQSNAVSCTACSTAVWTLSTDGKTLTKAADGTFLAIIDNP